MRVAHRDRPVQSVKILVVSQSDPAGPHGQVISDSGGLSRRDAARLGHEHRGDVGG